MSIRVVNMRNLTALVMMCLFIFSSGVNASVPPIEDNAGIVYGQQYAPEDTDVVTGSSELAGGSSANPEGTPESEQPTTASDFRSEGIVADAYDNGAETWRPDYDRSSIEWYPVEESATYRNMEIASDDAGGSIESVSYSPLTGVETVVAPQFTPTPETMAEFSATEPYAGLLDSYSIESIYGTDDRILISSQDVYPWRTVVKLYISASDGTNWIGSGAIIDNYHVMTAGHCAYLHDNGGWASSIEVVPAMDTADTPSDPYGHAWVTFMRSYTGWTSGENSQHDWAVLTLDRNIGAYTGWMGRMTAPSDSSIYTDLINLAGYPGDLDSGGRMYYSYDVGEGATEYNHYYDADTMGGMSGCPAWRVTGGNRYILTVHAYGGGGSPNPNYGTRLNQDKYDRIFTWLGDDTAPTDRPDMEDRGAAYRSATASPITAGVTSFTVSNYVRNKGTAYTGGYYVHYYASLNTYISTSDYYIGSDYISSHAPFSYASASYTGTFPNIPAGTYYIGWIIDRDNVRSEFDEGNNVAYISTPRTVVGAPPPTGYIEVNVKDSVTYSNLGSALVQVYDDTSTLIDAGYTNVNGFYNVTSLDIGWYTVYVSRFAYYEKSLQDYINWEGDDDYLYFYLDMMPEDSGYIEVNVKDSHTSSPLISALVETYNITSGLRINYGYTNGAGFYNITGLRIGWYEVRISKTSYKPQMQQQYINWNGDDDYLYFYLDQYPPDSGFIEVRVYNETGGPKQSAFIECVNDTSGLLIRTGYTDSNGFYNITGLTIGWYSINVTYVGYYEQSKSNYINWNGDDDYLTFYLMSLPPDSGYCEITVYDSVMYSPIASAYVEVVNQSSGLIIQTGYTDSSGFFKAEGLTVGWFAFDVTRVGYYGQSKTTYINWNGDDDYLIFWLVSLPPDSAYIEVNVKDINTNLPIASALVTCYFQNGTYFTSGYTDATGFLNVTGLYIGWYEIAVTHSEYGGESKTDYINWNGDDDYLYFYLDLKPPGYVEVTVLSSMTNLPMENVFVQCYNYTSGELVDSGYTDGSGFYNVTDLLVGWWLVDVSYPGYGRQSKSDYINWRGDDDYLTFYLSIDLPLFVGDVAIFRDRLPWNLNMTEPILEQNNIPYTVYDSSDFGQVDLSPYRKVIIPSDQTTYFYTALSGNRSWLESFVSQGGVLDLRLADHGWGAGSWDGLLMPGGLNKTTIYLDSVDINLPLHTLVNSPFVVEDVELDGWFYSAHGYFHQYPADAKKICLDTLSQEPVLLEFRIGVGFVIATMQTLEWNANLNYTRLLENMLLYDPLLGFDWVDITNPGASSTWPVSSTMGLTWDTTGTISNVKLELYENDAFVMEIADSTPNDGAFSWIIPSGLIDSNQYQIVISDYDYPSTNDTSEYFEILTDVSAPALDHPSDIEYSETTTGHAIAWTATDAYPVSFEIYRNGTMVKSGAWSSPSESISVDVDGLTLGVYNYTIVVADIGGNIDTDEVMVAVIDGTDPVLSTPLDIEYSEGTSGHSIEWTASDAHPVSFRISANGALQLSGTWSSSSLSIPVDGLPLGVWSYVIEVTDVGGNTATDEVLVTVIDTTNPTINHPLDIEFMEGSTGNNITWIPYDLHPGTYEIRRNGTLVQSGSWTGSSVLIGLDNTLAGAYTFTITVRDTSGNSVSDTVLVEVLPAGFGIMGLDTLTTTILLVCGGAVVVIIIIIILKKKK